MAFLFIILTITVLMVLYTIQNQTKRRIDFITLPNQPLFDLNDIEYNINDRIDNQAILIVFVQSDCFYCHQQIQLISDSIEYIKDLKVFIVSSESKTQLSFLNKLIINDRITLLADKNNAFTNDFKVNTYPTLFLFDKKKNFLKQFIGDTSFSKVSFELRQ